MLVGPRAKAYPIYAARSKQAIQHAIRVIRASELAPYVTGLYLYGSCARKEQRFDSDCL